MRSLRTTLVAAALVSGTVLVAQPAAARPTAAAAGAHRPITMVEIGGPFSGFVVDLSERGHVAFVNSIGIGYQGNHALRWHEGETVELTPDVGEYDVTLPTTVNRRGQVLGWTLNGPGGYWLWSDGVTTPLPPRPGEVIWVSDLDDRGRLLVNRAPVTDPPTAVRAAIVDGDRELTSPVLDDGSTIAGYGMNNRRQVIGVVSDETGDRAYLWQVGRRPVDLGSLGGTWTRPTQINERGTVLGTWITDDGDTRMFLWRNGTMTDLGTLGGRTTGAQLPTYAIGRPDQLNERGQVVGNSETASGEFHAFLWSDGRMRDLGTLGGSQSIAFGINDRGEVVGESQTASGETHAFLWRDGVMTDLAEGLVPAGQPSYAAAINDRGQVLGARIDLAQNYNTGLVWETRGRR
jgi:probable HAF family extracellular repeat protein